MNSFFISMPPFLEWLLRTSWQAAVLAGLVLAAQWVLGRRLTPVWRYRLWLLVMVRLVLPVQTSSPTSIHNLTSFQMRSPEADRPMSLVIPTVTILPETAPMTAAISHRDADVAVESPPQTAKVPVPESLTKPDNESVSAAGSWFGSWSWARFLTWAWALGAMVLAVRIAAQNIGFRRRLRAEAVRASSGVLDVLKACCRDLGVKTSIRAFETAQVRSPAMYGFIRPTLLLPRGLAAEFTAEQLRYVLLHEVAHVKRGDLIMTWVISGLQVLHWFNPVLWFAFGRMKVDRELACDALVLSRGRDDEAVGYGETILRLLEVMSRGPAMPGLVGILEDRKQIRERIQGIAGFRRPGRATALAGLLLVLLGWIGLTDAASKPGTLPPVRPLQLTNLLAAAENQAWINEAVWKVPPRGSNVFGGIEFHLDGLIRLMGTDSEKDGKQYRERVVMPLVETNGTGSKMRVVQHGTNIAALHLVGGATSDEKLETRIADLIWRYADGSFRRSPIRYGVHIRDWQRTRYEEPARLPGPHAKVVWRGTHPDVARRGKTLRLYRLSLANPEPRRVVRQVEFVSARSRASLFILALTLDSLKPGERPDASPDLEEVDPEPTGRILLTVQNESGQPEAGAEIRLRVREAGQSGNGVRSPKTFQSDTQGSAVVLYPNESIDRLQMEVSKEDFGTRKVVWDKTTGDDIPGSYTVKLTKAVQLGGTIADPEGNPVEGATVTLTRYWTGGESQSVKGEEIDFARQTHTTGPDGRWLARQVPPEILHRVGIEAEHPDYIGGRIGFDTTEADLEALKQGTHILKLSRGLNVVGRVEDDSGNPISNATVWAGGRNFPDRKETRTDAAGRFTFRNVSAGRTLFSVAAKGREPGTQTLNVSADMAEVVFQLAAGNLIKARVQNVDGEPIASARVVLEGAGNIGRTYEFSTRTDEDGRFEWDGAPRDPMQFYFYAPGYEQKRDAVLRPGQDNVVVLQRSRRVIGQVVDADTGQPVGRFRVGAGRAWQEQLEQFYPDHPGLVERLSPEGRFEIELNEEQTNALRAEAEDYAPLIQLLPEAEGNEVKVVVRFQRSDSLRGVVVDPAGRPLRDAHLFASPAPGPDPAVFAPGMVTLKAGRLETHGPRAVVTSDENGKFIISSPPIDGTLVAAHPLGFASVRVAEVRATGQLVLQPYGQIEASYSVLGQPVEGQEFLLNLNALGVMADFQAHRGASDARGRFTIKGVPAGRIGLVRLVKTSPRSWVHSQETPVTVEPGHATEIMIGGEGAVIQGRARLEGAQNSEDLVITANLQTPGPKVPEGLTPDQLQAYFASREWQEQMRNQKRYAVQVRPDGSLQVDSVSPGKYELFIEAAPGSDEPWTQRPIASARAEVTIPDHANPMAPIIIGELILKPVTPP